MKEKRTKLKITVVIMLLLLMVNPWILEVKGNGYYSESLFFDSDGNFYMTTYDIKAAKSTRYCTLGWTIKRYDLPLDDPQNMYTAIVLTCDGSVEDPKDERYLYSYFHCDKDTIFEAIGSSSAEWQRELYMDGGTVYLDGIMTVIENNKVLGSLSSDGKESGEVYYTYEGIVSARNWGSKSKDSLRTHFNKSVYFPAVESFFNEEEDSSETREYGSIRENFYWWGPELEAGITVSAAEYDPAVAIPAGENVEIYGWQQACAYIVEYEKVKGEIACDIPIELFATKTETDENGLPVVKQVSVYEGTYKIMLPYTYYALGGVELCCADGIELTSEAFDEVVRLDTYYNPDVIITVYSGDEHVMYEPVTETVPINIGTLTDSEAITACIKNALNGVADKPKVRNDYLSIGEGIVMNDEWCDDAGEPNRISLSGNNEKVSIKIPDKTPNAEYKIKARAHYCSIVPGWSGGETITRVLSDVEDIIVHTPVVCYGELEDIKEWNQAEMPDLEHPTIVLGKEFFAEVSNKGMHIGAKGYGIRDYKEYVLYNQVRFPFDVFNEENELISAGTWIELRLNTKFTLPVTVSEGEYSVEFRSVASNYDEKRENGQNAGKNANLLPGEQIAADTVTVSVIGQIYDFELTEVIEYKSVVNLKELMGNCDVSKLPFVWKDGLLTGSYFKFRLKSVGGYDKKAKVTIIPSFWYIDNEIPVEVDIYYEDVRHDGKLVLKKMSTDSSSIELTEDDCQLMDYNAQGSVEAGQTCGKYQLWTGIYMLPMRSFCLPKDRSLPVCGVDKRNFIEAGHVLVKFDIRIEDENGKNVLLYINSKNAQNGYCNRWKKEGGNDGEVIIYNIGASVKDSMKVTGTH